MSKESKVSKRTDKQEVGLGIVFGSALGAGFGIVTGNNMAVTAGIGTMVGILIGTVIWYLGQRKKNEQN